MTIKNYALEINPMKKAGGNPNRNKGKVAYCANEFYMEIHLTKHENSIVKRILKGKEKGRNSVKVW